MIRYAAGALAVVLVSLNAAMHGAWSHRWAAWTDAPAQAKSQKLDAVPLQAGEWDGARIEADPLGIAEEIIGRGVNLRYTSRVDGTVVMAYVACGPTDALIGHVPTVCYPANGYEWRSPDLRTTLDSGGAGTGGEFWVSQFTRPQADVPVHLRVFWSWSDGGPWRVPGNPGRAFRRTPVLYKCYFVRQIAGQDEPVEGDPCYRLMAALVPKLNEVLGVESGPK